jgi:dihydroorotate dehydrogenase electron transfer subunit
MSAPSRCIQFQRVAIVANEQIAQSTFEVTLHCPQLARDFVPGQFAMLKVANQSDAILGRAFAFWDRSGTTTNPENVSFVYLVKGRMTSKLALLSAGNEIDIWGPLGNGFSDQPTDHLVLVAGGVGQTPMLTVANEALGRETYSRSNRHVGYAKSVTLIYGARAKAYLAGLSKFEQVNGLKVVLTTEDGSCGLRGRVTDALRDLIERRDTAKSMRVCCCGPEPMMEAVDELASEHNVSCEVSLETPMACGIGICFTCVAKIKQDDGQWDYRRTCIEGPVFDARSVCW